MATRVRPTHPPKEPEIKAAHEALPEVQAFLRRHHDATVVTVHVTDDHTERTLEVPRSAVELLAEVLVNMAKGRAVSIVPAHAELTTQQAADMLHVSRPFLIGLLDAGEIDHHRVGTHRRIKAEDLLAYKRADDLRRRQAVDELTALTQDMELY
jgi:excisionase family DNA binding protein